MATVNEVYQLIDRYAPFSTQMGFDNAGFLVGRGEAEVTKILLALDITLPVIEEAKQLGAELIVSHHPAIFDPVKRIVAGDPTGDKLMALIENKIAAICAHTNLDAAQGGVNDCLAQALCLSYVEMLEYGGVDHTGRPYGIGRIGAVHEEGLTAKEYAAFVKEQLETSSVRYVDAGKPVHKVAVGGGSCGSMLMDAVKAGCDTFVTSDVKYNVFLEAKALGINLMDAGHYATENVITPALVEFLSIQMPKVPVHLSKVHEEVYQEAQ